MSIFLPPEPKLVPSGASQLLSVEYFDNLGKSESVSVSFTPTVPGVGTSNEWTMTLTDSAQGGATIGEYTLTFDDSRTSGGTLLSVATVSGGAYDPVTGSLIVNVDGGPMEINIGEIGAPDGLTQLSDSFAPLSISKDGSPVGNMTSAQVDENGFVRASFDTGVTPCDLSGAARRPAESQWHVRSGSTDVYSIARQRNVLPLECR